jgi:hypothetical protein
MEDGDKIFCDYCTEPITYGQQSTMCEGKDFHYQNAHGVKCWRERRLQVLKGLTREETRW